MWINVDKYIWIVTKIVLYLYSKTKQMKKLILAVAILFSVSVKAQDTSYYFKQTKLYMQIRNSIEVTNPTQKESAYIIARKRKIKQDKKLTIIVGTIFTTLSIWFFCGSK